MLESLRIIPLGGLGEIGKNMMVFEYGDDIMIVDAGIMFPSNDMLGVDLVLPDWSYLRDKVDQIRGIVITHGHEDHLGALPYFLHDLELDVPIYATRLVQGLIDRKLRDAKLQKQCERVEIKAGEPFLLGPFEIEGISFNHSIPDGVALAIRTPAGMVLHSGDFKFDYSPVHGTSPDFGRLAQLGAEGVMVLLADSTGAERPGWTPSEAIIADAFDRIFRDAPGRIIVSTFASLLSRVQQILDAAHAHRKKVALAGYSMLQNVKIARKLGYLNVPRGTLIELEKIKSLDPKKTVIITTGAQGQPEAALARIATNKHRDIKIIPGDTVILSSHPIPGNEEMISEMINRLFRRGAEVIYPPLAPVHVSGHAAQEEMKLLLTLTSPEYFVPVHGELRHLKAHARLAKEVGVPEDYILTVENGTVLEFDEDGALIRERIPGGYIFVDGSRVGDIGPSVLRDRDVLGSHGFVMVAFVWNSETRKVEGQPEIISRGFIYEKESQDLLSGARDHLIETLDDTSRVSKRGIEEASRLALSRYFYEQTGRRPLVVPMVVIV
ncbi:MAG: ribonuclease J [Chloroflexota bacterium]|nr:ribonuclease J [Chloroflexota bacterium]